MGILGSGLLPFLFRVVFMFGGEGGKPLLNRSVVLSKLNFDAVLLNLGFD